MADELAAFGFDWFALDEAPRLAAWLADPDDLLERNLAVARRHFSLADLPARLAPVLVDLGVLGQPDVSSGGPAGARAGGRSTFQ